MKKSVITRVSLRSDKDVETYLLKSRSDDNEKMSCYRQFNRGFNFYKENYIHDIPGSHQVLPWNLRQLISYFFALIMYSINLLKTARKTFATGNAIYPLPRTTIQITNDNSIFRKEGITAGLC
jgi:hypothetical protein